VPAWVFRRLYRYWLILLTQSYWPTNQPQQLLLGYKAQLAILDKALLYMGSKGKSKYRMGHAGIVKCFQFAAVSNQVKVAQTPIVDRFLQECGGLCVLKILKF